MNKRNTKDLLFEQVARIGRALASPKRLELLDVLAQGEKTVEGLSQELSIDVKLASAHLKAMRHARLVESRREGKYIFYRLAGGDVASLWVNLREVAREHLVELRLAVERLAGDPEKLTKLSRHDLLLQAKRGDIVVIDVRPQAEFDSAHLPYARSMPVAELERRLAELPRRREIVAYCRGPFCMFSDEALKLLHAKGYKARKLLDGVNEWQVAGMPLERAANA